MAAGFVYLESHRCRTGSGFDMPLQGLFIFWVVTPAVLLIGIPEIPAKT